MPLRKGVLVQKDRLFILTPKGILEKEFRVSPKPLSSIFTEDTTVSDMVRKEVGQKRAAPGSSCSSGFDGMSTEEIIRAMKKQRTESGIPNEKRMALLMQHLVTQDPQLGSTGTDQLVEQILRIPFSASFLTKELRDLQPRLNPRQGLLLAHKFTDRLDEHDQYSLFCGDITSCILDVSMTGILTHQQDLYDLLQTLMDKMERLFQYFVKSTSLKSQIDSLAHGPGRTRVKPCKPEYERRMTKI